MREYYDHMIYNVLLYIKRYEVEYTLLSTMINNIIENEEYM